MALQQVSPVRVAALTWAAAKVTGFIRSKEAAADPLDPSALPEPADLAA